MEASMKDPIGSKPAREAAGSRAMYQAMREKNKSVGIIILWCCAHPHNSTIGTVSFPQKREAPFRDAGEGNSGSRFRGNDIVGGEGWIALGQHEIGALTPTFDG